MAIDNVCIRGDMMISSFDIADISIAAVLESHPELRLNEAGLPRIKACCEILDKIAAENEFDSVHTDVNTDCNELLVSLVCPAFDFADGRSSAFFDAIERSRYFFFRNNGDGNVCLTVVYDGVFQ